MLPLTPSGYKRCVPFRRMLGALVERVPGARGAVFCDYEGEFVDLVIRDPRLSEYDMKLFGAHLAAAWLTLITGAAGRGAGDLAEVRIGCPGGTLLCRALPDGYYLVLLLASGVPGGPASFELQRAALAFAEELSA